jgi:hypothetical protein
VRARTRTLAAWLRAGAQSNFGLEAEESQLQKETQELFAEIHRRPHAKTSSICFLSFFLSFVVSFVSRAFICHSCCHYCLQHSKAKQQSLCCLLALLTCLLQYPSSFLLLLQSSSKEFIATSLLRVQFLLLFPPFSLLAQ